MSSVVIAGNTSGSVTLAAPDVAGTTTLTLPNGSGTVVTSTNINTYASSFPAGTRLSFQQTSAPTGWTKDTTAGLDDSVMRIVTGTASSGGSTAFSTFNGQTTVGATTLSSSQVPNATGSLIQQGNRAGLSGSTGVFSSVGGTGYAGVGTTAPVIPASFNFSLGFGGGSHNHSITTSIKYYDFIIASKD